MQAVAISAQGYGWAGAPAIYTPEQTAGWAEVVKAVKAEPVHGAFFLQLWHMGRQSHSTYVFACTSVLICEASS